MVSKKRSTPHPFISKALAVIPAAPVLRSSAETTQSGLPLVAELTYIDVKGAPKKNCADYYSKISSQAAMGHDSTLAYWHD